MDIYNKFDRATGNLSAYALLWQGKAVGRLVIKFGNAATAYVQIWGAEMVSSRATGYGYDKASAAVMDALAKLATVEAPYDHTEAFHALLEAQRCYTGSRGYDAILRDVGFDLALVI